MRRVVALVPVVLSLALAGLAVVPAAEAASPLTGKLVDSTGANPAAVGAEVRLRSVDPGGAPGPVVATDTTDGSGQFELDAGPSPDDEYYVQVLAGDYQGGYVGGDPLYVQPTAGLGGTFGPHAALGKVWANPAFISGTVVSSVTKKPVAGVKVAARSHNDGWQTEGTAFTSRLGTFTISGLECEDDCYLKVDGSAKGYEIGFRDCNGTVVADWGDACASPIGRIGKVRLDKS